MRTLLSIILLFSLGTICAQQYTPSYGREQPRSNMLVYPTPEEASAAAPGNNKFLTRLSEWTQTGNVFSTSFTVPFAWANRQVLFQLERASTDYEVRVNDQIAAYNGNGNAPADFNITKYAQEGRNTVEVIIRTPSSVAPLESWKQNPAPEIGTAYVMSQPTMRVRDILTKVWRSDATVTAEVGIVVKSNALNPRTSRIYYDLLTPSGKLAATGHKDITQNMRQEDTLRFLTVIPADSLWNTDIPARYTLRIKTQYEGRAAECMEFKLGFRLLRFENGKLTVNDRPVTLRVKEASPRITRAEVQQIRDLGYNTLKMEPGAISEWLYEFCDMEGLYVIVQAPIDTRASGMSRRKGGNPTNDPAWLEAYLERTSDSYHTAKRHPSVIAFSMAQKSANGINLYESYLKMKRFGDIRPFLYFDAAGEWNSDKLEFGFEPGTDE